MSEREAEANRLIDALLKAHDVECGLQTFGLQAKRAPAREALLRGYLAAPAPAPYRPGASVPSGTAAERWNTR